MARSRSSNAPRRRVSGKAPTYGSHNSSDSGRQVGASVDAGAGDSGVLEPATPDGLKFNTRWYLEHYPDAPPPFEHHIITAKLAPFRKKVIS